MSTPFHVIVIGAGTGGMCLAHGLKRAGISVAVYERDRTRSDGLLGYRVGIDPDGSRALAACLPPELFDTFIATCARGPRYFSMLTEQLKPVLTLKLPPQDDPIESEKSVSRMTLRQVLMTGVEDIVHFEKVFTHYDQGEDGKVTAYFEDGTSATGDVLVAADGTNSRVRQQYLPDAKLRESGVISVAGKVAITEESRALISPEVFEGLSLIFAPKGFFCILHVMEFKWDQQGHTKNGIGAADTELLKQWPGLLYDNTRDYINWGFAASADRLPDNVMKLRGGELVKLVKDITPNWSPNMQQLFDLTDLSTCFPINIMTSEPVDQWQASNVTLIGDAIHTMTPGRGVGANTALRDAELLCRNLVAARDGKWSLLESIGDYETRMVKYGFAAVEASLKQQGGDSIMHKPVLGRAALTGMRTGLRLVNAVPALQRKFTENLYADRKSDRKD